MLIDAHTHLDKYSDEEVDAVLALIERNRVFSLSVSENVATFERTEAIASRSEHVVAGFGIHPWQAPEFVDLLDTLEEVVDRAAFVGEVGLDHRFVTDESHFEPQRRVFSTLLAMAREQDKLVNVHCVGAEADTLEMLVSSRVERVIIHWYSGPLDVLARMVDQGFMFTVGVELLHSEHIRAVARAIPADQLLTETDNPGALRWLVGTAGTPHLITEVVDELARVRDVSPEDLGSAVHANAARLFENDRHLAKWSTLLG